MSGKVNKIYVDMDGVLCDFRGRYKELFDYTPVIGKKEKNFTENFEKIIKDRHFATLRPLKDAWALLHFLNGKCAFIPKEILSSTAREEYYDEVSEQKEEWLNDHNIHYKRNFVPGKSKKKEFATPDAILIDDEPSNIDDWNKAGGIGILHTDAISTIAMLRMYV